jgi:hypothetical protein
MREKAEKSHHNLVLENGILVIIEGILLNSPFAVFNKHLIT